MSATTGRWSEAFDAVDLLVAARNHCAVLYAEVSDRGIQYVVDLAGGILRRESVLVDRSDIGQERGHRGDDVRTGNGVEVARKDEVSVQFRVADTADLIGLHQAARIARKMIEVRRGDIEVFAVDLDADDAQRTVLARLRSGAGEPVTAGLYNRVFRQHGVAVFASVAVDGFREVPLHTEFGCQVAGLVYVFSRAVGEDIHLVEGYEVGVLPADYLGQRVQIGCIGGACGACAVNVVGHYADDPAFGWNDCLVSVLVVVIVVVGA